MFSHQYDIYWKQSESCSIHIQLMYIQGQIYGGAAGPLHPPDGFKGV